MDQWREWLNGRRIVLLTGGIAGFQANVTNSIIRVNAANFGGGIDVINANLTNTTVIGNSASSDGGGVRAARATLNGCTEREKVVTEMDRYLRQHAGDAKTGRQV